MWRWAEIPVGAVVVGGDGVILGRGFNRREQDCDASAHAEIVALREAGAKAAGGSGGCWVARCL